MTEPQYYEYLLQRSKRMNGWQPIETAPKDIEILLYCPHQGHSGIFTGIRVSGQKPEFESNSIPHCCDWTGAESLEPTHWQHLPEPPIIVEQDSPTNPSQSPL